MRSGWVFIAAAVACMTTSLVSVPVLVLAVGGIGRSSGGSCRAGAPTIVGTAVLSSDQLARWWAGLRRGQPAGLGEDVTDLIELYLDEAETEGVRGDLAFAQAVHETGYFTSSDTARNNFAGIAHLDGASAGATFPDIATGVRAHIQLLKRYAVGNDTRLASPDVAPRAGARATTWAELAGTWATDPSYWTSISAIHEDMRDGAPPPSPSNARPGGDSCEVEQETAQAAAATHPDLVTVRGITVDASIADQLERLLAAAEADGLLLNGSGYRSHERQIELRRAHCGSSNYAIYEMPSSQCSPPTARPGDSMHEQGLAIDFTNCSTHSTACWQWLNANAASYGLYNLPSEPWHWSTTAT